MCNFVVEKFNSDDDKKTVSLLIDCPVEELKDNKTYLSKLITWFSTNTTPAPDYINNFLKNLDEFDLNQYIKAIHFDEMKVPFVPFYKSTSKSYYGIEDLYIVILTMFQVQPLLQENVLTVTIKTENIL